MSIELLFIDKFYFSFKLKQDKYNTMCCCNKERFEKKMYIWYYLYHKWVKFEALLLFGRFVLWLFLFLVVHNENSLKQFNSTHTIVFKYQNPNYLHEAGRRESAVDCLVTPNTMAAECWWLHYIALIWQHTDCSNAHMILRWGTVLFQIDPC